MINNRSFPLNFLSLFNANTSHPNALSFSEVFNGDKAFYHQNDYSSQTTNDFSQRKTLPVSYTWNTEHKMLRILKTIFSIIIFPVGIYQLAQVLAGKIAILPSSAPGLFGLYPHHQRRSEIPLSSGWKYKRLTIEVDGYKIDAMIVGFNSTLNNGRWLLASNGNLENYESKLVQSHDFRYILTQTKANAIVFNYPGVGASTGLPSRGAMTKAYRAMLAFLEDKNGIGAKEIIGYGHSIGGGVQGDALNTHELKQDIKYVFVKNRTFSDLADTASSLFSTRLIGFFVKILGWNLSSVDSSKNLMVPEIILQTADVTEHTLLEDSVKIINDGVISYEASLARALLDDPSCKRRNKLFIGINEDHADQMKNTTLLTQAINKYLSD